MWYCVHWSLGVGGGHAKGPAGLALFAKEKYLLNKIGNSPSMANPAGDIVPTEKLGWLVERKGNSSRWLVAEKPWEAF